MRNELRPHAGFGNLPAPMKRTAPSRPAMGLFRGLGFPGCGRGGEEAPPFGPSPGRKGWAPQECIVT